MCGSHGTLGVVLDVAVKLLPLPECEQSLARECEPLQAMQIMQSLRSKPLPLSGAAWDAGVLRLRLEGAASAVGRAGPRWQRHAPPADLEQVLQRAQARVAADVKPN
jgi:glycolate oxidase FAD binding subunit